MPERGKTGPGDTAGPAQSPPWGHIPAVVSQGWARLRTLWIPFLQLRLIPEPPRFVPGEEDKTLG